MTPEEKAVVDAAIAYVERYMGIDDEMSREGWALYDAVGRLPRAKVTPIYS